MPAYEFQLPDGGTYQIEVPEGTSGQQAYEMLQRQIPQQPAAAPEEPSTLEDVGRGLVSGVGRGVAGMWGLATGVPGGFEWLGRQALNRVLAEPISTETELPTPLESMAFTQQQLERVAPIMGHKPETAAGGIAQRFGEFVPGVAFPAAGGAGILGRLGANVVAPALGAETAGQATRMLGGGETAQSIARVAGGLGGGVFGPRAMRAISQPTAVSPIRQAQTATLEQAGVRNILPGQRTGNKWVRYMEDPEGFFGSSEAQNIKSEQLEDFTRAVMREAGQNTLAGQDDMRAAFRDLGNTFDQIQQTSTVAPSSIDPNDGPRLAGIYRNYAENVTDEVPVIRRLHNELTDILANRSVTPGRRMTILRKDIAKAARKRPIDDYAGREALDDMRELVDDLTERNLPPSVRGDYANARRQYRALTLAEKAVRGAGGREGIITPAALEGAIKSSGGTGTRELVTGRSTLAELARAGANILEPLPQSGTAPRLGAAALGSMLTGAVGGADMGASALGGVFGPSLLGAAIRSPMGAAYLGRQAGPAAARAGWGAGLTTIPGGALAGVDREPTRVSVYPAGDPRNMR